MKSSITYYLLLFCLCCASPLSAQFSKEKFLSDFKKASTGNKVQLAASIASTQLYEVYPLIKDTLAKIKKCIYEDKLSDSRAIKFLFDRIEASMELHEHNYAKAILILEESLQERAANVDDTLHCFSILKNAFIKMHNVNRAFEMQYLIERRWHRKTDTAVIDFGMSKSELYGMMGLKTDAIIERRREFNNRGNKKDTDAIVSFYNDMGVFFNKKKNSDSAEFYFLRARTLLASKKIPKDKESYYDFYKGLIEGNLGLSYYNRGNINDAIPLLKRDIYYSMRSGFYESAFNSYILIIQCYIELKNKELAARYTDTVQCVLHDRLKGDHFKLKLMPVLASYYELAKDYKRSAEVFREYVALNNSYVSLEKEKEVINQEVIFNLEQRELEYIEKDKMARQGLLTRAQQKSYEAYLWAGFAILCVIILFLMYNNRMFKKRQHQLSFKNTQIRQQNAQIEHSLKEKEALIKEIHHRVKNNLQIITSMLNLQIGKVDDEKTSLILLEAKQRINAIALTHQMLYQKVTLSNILLSEYIEKLVRQIEATMASPLIELVVDVSPSDKQLTIDGAVPLGLIINELLTNSYKHAFPQGRQGKITVSLTENPESFTIKVGDDGVGLDDGFDSSENKTLGMELVHILVEQLDSELIVEKDGVTVFKFDIQKTQLK